MTTQHVTATSEIRTRMATLNGLEVVAALADGSLPSPSMKDVTPFTLLAPSEGRVELTATPDARFLNPGGTIHGGWTMTMLDTAQALAATTTLAAGEICPTHETSVKFVRPITADAGALRITGTVVSKSRAVVTLEGRVADASGRVLAHGTSTCLIVSRRS
jgi:uncharacterized protein (TIGR00369 family)